MKYTLRQLQVFLATARHENVSRAADELAMSQSAASGALKEIEGQFGVQLFDRVGKRLQLSELGRNLRAQAESLLLQAEAFEQALAGGQGVGTLRIGATLTIGNYLAVGLIAAFRQQFPSAEVALEVANTATIARKVADFELDLGMIEGEISSPQLETIHWRDDALQVFTAPSHPLARKRRATDTDLAGQQWIVREPGSGTRQTFDRAMHGLLGNLDIAMELQHTEAIKRAVEAGLGVGCLSRISLADAFARGSLVPVNVPQRDFSRQLNLIARRDRYNGAATRHWLALCAANSRG